MSLKLLRKLLRKLLGKPFQISALGLVLTTNAAAAADPVKAPPKEPDTVTVEMLRLRDPFKRTVPPTAPQAPKPPLESFPAYNFKYIGFVSGPLHRRAVVQPPDGPTIIVSERMKIGNQSGVITQINKDAIVVHEQVPNQLGIFETIETLIPIAVDKSERDKTARSATLPPINQRILGPTGRGTGSGSSQSLYDAIMSGTYTANPATTQPNTLPAGPIVTPNR